MTPTASAAGPDRIGADGAGPDSRPLLLLVTTGGRLYREYLLRSIRTRFRVHLLLGTEPNWELDYLYGFTILSDLTSTTDVDEMVAAAREVIAREPMTASELGRGAHPAKREVAAALVARWRSRHDHAVSGQAANPADAGAPAPATAVDLTAT
jgi:hypothetical protein